MKFNSKIRFLLSLVYEDRYFAVVPTEIRDRGDGSNGIDDENNQDGDINNHSVEDTTSQCTNQSSSQEPKSSI